MGAQPAMAAVGGYGAVRETVIAQRVTELTLALQARVLVQTPAKPDAHGLVTVE